MDLLSTNSFALSPGEGGATTWEHTGGGGGGGVLVNGRAPVAGSIYCGQVGLIEMNMQSKMHSVQRCLSLHSAQGYGGGAWAGDRALPGVVLLELKDA